ncbi:TPA: hypothetical protein N0F65_011710 [Lagenidium giganteum]|uniref:Anoctamin transmembrane domain-containing protein n=1 Tax=Lagenidium giganteum TaxID=4803 RepID=A0AAV2YTA1_9STRA|nr:TPA: hypothetical protein N0F65_011710 [Lagenidium giganteum]
MSSGNETAHSYHSIHSPMATPTHADVVTLEFDDARHMAQHHGDATTKIEFSGYEQKLYDVDLVMIFPRRQGGEVKHPEAFTVHVFVSLLMGKKTDSALLLSSRGGIRASVAEAIEIDTVQRVLRTPRCYLDDAGRDVFNKDEDPLKQMEDLLTQEYEREIGSLEPTSELQFCELVAKAMARRVQIACGLTTRMFLSCDADEIVMTIKADDNDLRVEADRTNYRLQVSNRPFDADLHHDKLQRVRREVGATDWANSIEHLYHSRPGREQDPKAPEMDPQLISNGEHYHPKLNLALKEWGHTEETDGRFLEDPKAVPCKFGRWRRYRNAVMSLSYDPMTYFAPYADYRIEPMYQPYYRRYPLIWGTKKEETLFAQKDRIRLATSIVHRHLNVDALLVANYLVGDMFALHDDIALKDLRHVWALRWTMVNQPLNKIRFYFGEKIALYFAWLGFYTKMLVLPSIAGIITHIVVGRGEASATRREKGYILIAFSVFVVVWSALFTEMWKRKNALLNGLWGLHGFHREQRYRAKFRGKKSYNPVNDEEEMTYENKAARRRAFMISIIVVLIMIAIVIVAIGGLFWLKFAIRNDEGNILEAHNMTSLSGHKDELVYAVSGVNAVQILIFNVIYRGVARVLNEWENHRTDREYENHLVLKVFLFQFCNSFASLFYIAFIKTSVEKTSTNPGCMNGDCMDELGNQLLILFLIRILAGNFMEVVIPYLQYRYKLFVERKAVSKQKHNYIEEQAKLMPYEQEEAFEDYNEMVIQFGYITLFVVAYPLTPLLALANNVAEVHVDSVKLCFMHRRPFPYPAKSIGAWHPILRFMTYVSLATNAALILWTSKFFDDDPNDTTTVGMTFTPNTKGLAFVICCQVCFVMNVLIERFIPDVPAQLDMLMRRHDYIVARVFKGLHEGDDSHLRETAEEVNLKIYPNAEWEDRNNSRAYN